MRALVLSCCLFLFAPGLARADDVLVFAAASLAGPLDVLADDFEAATGHSVTLSYAGSSTLARQVEAGAPADVILLANEAWMDRLQGEGLLQDGTRHALLRNRLVVIANPPEPMFALDDLVQRSAGARLALALTEAVPAGLYAREALEALDLWEALRPQIIEADNVRAALQLVAIGAAQYGMVYGTDARTEPRVTVVAEVPEALHAPILYPMAVTARGDDVAAAFAQSLQTDAAAEVFEAAGFGRGAP